MALWQRTLDLTSWWNTPKVEDGGTLTPQIAAREIVRGLRELAPFPYPFDFVNEVRDEIIEYFESLADDEIADWEDFDCNMDALYDFGNLALDTKWNGKKVCWIKTF